MHASSKLLTPEELTRRQFGCLLGTAGTGKTTLAREWAADRGVLCATTGIAAVNLGDATTINSLLGYFDTKAMISSYAKGFLVWRLRRLYRAGIRRIVLDEVSMFDGDQFTTLVSAIDDYNETGVDLDQKVTSTWDENTDPLGLLLVGDFAQLSPVNGPFAFETASWGRFDEATCVLDKIHRQADPAFKEALQTVRQGREEEALAYFGPRLESDLDMDFFGTTLCGTNPSVSRHNRLQLNKLNTAICAFPSERWGKLRGEWGTEKVPKVKWLIPDVLEIKEQALVMILANKKAPSMIGGKDLVPKFEYVNGDLGVFLGTQDHGIRDDGTPVTTALVQLQREDRIVEVEWVTRTNTKTLEPGRRKELKEQGLEHLIDGKEEIIGAITYMPLRVAYASTVHKSQGLTLDTVQISLADSFFTHPGMLYVALSRCRTSAGMRIVGTKAQFLDRIRVNEKVRRWL